MSDKMRSTKRSLRVTNSKHNDLNFDLSNAKQHDPSRVDENLYWTYYDRDDVLCSFDYAEARFYEEHFREFLDFQNSAHVSRRQYGRVKTMDEFRHSKNYCPEEYIFQIGSVKDAKAKRVSAEQLESCVDDYMDWEMEWSRAHGSPFKVVNVAFHFSETTPHVHARRVWLYEDENGMLRVGQDKALEKAGVPLPNPDAKRSRYNNRKMTFDKMCREKWLDILEKHGFDIERVPLPDTHHVPNGQYQVQQAHKAELLRQENERLRAQNNNLRAQETNLKESLSKAKKDAQRASEAILSDSKVKAKEIVENAKKDAQRASNGLLEGAKAKVDELKSKIEGLNASIKLKEEELKSLTRGVRVVKADRATSNISRNRKLPEMFADYDF